MKRTHQVCNKVCNNQYFGAQEVFPNFIKIFLVLRVLKYLTVITISVLWEYK